MSRRNKNLDLEENDDDWFWGNHRGGGGAPLKDVKGNQVANLKKVLKGDVEIDHSPTNKSPNKSFFKGSDHDEESYYDEHSPVGNNRKAKFHENRSRRKPNDHSKDIEKIRRPNRFRNENFDDDMSEDESLKHGRKVMHSDLRDSPNKNPYRNPASPEQATNSVKKKFMGSLLEMNVNKSERDAKIRREREYQEALKRQIEENKQRKEEEKRQQAELKKVELEEYLASSSSKTPRSNKDMQFASSSKKQNKEFESSFSFNNDVVVSSKPERQSGRRSRAEEDGESLGFEEQNDAYRRDGSKSSLPSRTKNRLEKLPLEDIRKGRGPTGRNRRDDNHLDSDEDIDSARRYNSIHGPQGSRRSGRQIGQTDDDDEDHREYDEEERIIPGLPPRRPPRRNPQSENISQLLSKPKNSSAHRNHVVTSDSEESQINRTGERSKLKKENIPREPDLPLIRKPRGARKGIDVDHDEIETDPRLAPRGKVRNEKPRRRSPDQYDETFDDADRYIPKVEYDELSALCDKLLGQQAVLEDEISQQAKLIRELQRMKKDSGVELDSDSVKLRSRSAQSNSRFGSKSRISRMDEDEKNENIRFKAPLSDKKRPSSMYELKNALDSNGNKALKGNPTSRSNKINGSAAPAKVGFGSSVSSHRLDVSKKSAGKLATKQEESNRYKNKPSSVSRRSMAAGSNVIGNQANKLNPNKNFLGSGSSKEKKSLRSPPKVPLKQLKMGNNFKGDQEKGSPLSGFAKLKLNSSNKGPVVVSYSDDNLGVEDPEFIVHGNRAAGSNLGRSSLELKGKSEYLDVPRYEGDIVTEDQLDKLLKKAKNSRS